jgi:hypothetical protein
VTVLEPRSRGQEENREAEGGVGLKK